MASKIVYNPALDAMSGQKSISLQKPTAFFNAFVRTGRVEVMNLDTATQKDELFGAHDQEFVQDVLRGEVSNGYGNTSLAHTVHAMAQCEVMKEAALWAWNSHSPVCAPVQGFHHAGFDFCYGYCTFNGLIVAARSLRQNGFDRPILILDCDGHFGDGTDDILNRRQAHDPLLSQVFNISLEKHNYSEDRIRSALGSHGPSMVLYQAGADAHIDDPYCAGHLTTEGMRKRDLTVFSTCRKMGHDVVWNLAGGYSDPDFVIRLHLQTAEMCDKVWEL